MIAGPTLAFEGTFFEALSKGNLREWRFTAPVLVRSVEPGCLDFDIGPVALCTALIEKSSERIHIVFIVGSGGLYFLWDAESILVPVETALHGPAENAGEFSPQLRWEVLILLLVGDGDRKGYEP